MVLRTSYVTCVPCLFRIMVSSTSYGKCVACLIRLSDSCYMLSVPVSILQDCKNELWYMCSMLVLTHGKSTLQEIPSESMCFQWIRWTPSEDSPNLLSKYCLHFRFHVMTRLPVTQVDSTVLPVSFFDQTSLDFRFCPLESSREYWTFVEWL